MTLFIQNFIYKCRKFRTNQNDFKVEKIKKAATNRLSSILLDK